MEYPHEHAGPLLRFRFSILLAALIMFLIAMPIIGALRETHSMTVLSLAMNLAFLFVLVVTVLTVARGPRARWVAFSLLVPIVALTLYDHLLGKHNVAVSTYGISTLLLAYTIGLIAVFVFKQRLVTLDLVSAALCGYLLIGVMWALIYVQLEIYVPGSMKLPGGLTSGIDFLAQRSEGSVLAMYYSFITLTTVGYGDIVPLSGFARMVAVCEGILGQFYMVVLVARLVGMHVAIESTRSHR